MSKNYYYELDEIMKLRRYHSEKAIRDLIADKRLCFSINIYVLKIMKESESLSNDETLAVARMQNMSVFQSNSLVGITFTMSNNKHKE